MSLGGCGAKTQGRTRIEYPGANDMKTVADKVRRTYQSDQSKTSPITLSVQTDRSDLSLKDTETRQQQSESNDPPEKPAMIASVCIGINRNNKINGIIFFIRMSYILLKKGSLFLL